MKKVFILIALVFSFTVNAQVKEGVIKFKMELTGGPGGNEASSLLGNTSMTIYFKNDKSLTDMVTPVYTMKTMTDNKGVLMLMDGGGQKIFSKKTKEELDRDKPKGSDPQIVITKEKKKIMGYDCTKAIISMKDNKGRDAKTTVWYTDKIRSIAAAGLMNTNAMQKINGMALQVEMDQGPIQSKMTATEISLKPVADAVFALSTVGYTEKKVTAPAKH